MIAEIKKTCSRCGTEKPLSGFTVRKISADGHRGICKACLNSDNETWRESNRETHRAGSREYARLHRKENAERAKEWRDNHDDIKKYHKEAGAKRDRFALALGNINRHSKQNGYAECTATRDEIEASYTGFCEVCGVSEADVKGRLCLDHCHVTGNFRGHICRRCNSVLGLVGDSFELLRNAADFAKYKKELHEMTLEKTT